MNAAPRVPAKSPQWVSSPAGRSRPVTGRADHLRHFAVVHSEALPFLDDNLEVVLIEHAARVLRAEEPDRTTVLLQQCHQVPVRHFPPAFQSPPGPLQSRASPADSTSLTSWRSRRTNDSKSSPLGAFK